MKRLKRILLGLALLVSFSTTTYAQGYKTGVGARLGFDSGLTVKHFMNTRNAVEGILSFSPKYFQVTGLYQWQQPVQQVQNLSWYYGGGVHLGAIHKNKDDYSNSFLVGIDGIIGAEYAFPTVPLTLGLDWKPAVNFTNSYNDYWYAGFALSLRYVF